MAKDKPQAVVHVAGVAVTQKGSLYPAIRDRKGLTYRYKPDAKVPASNHSIIYPPHLDVVGGDEDIPIQNRSGSKINGASPELLIVAVLNEMLSTPDADKMVIYHLERAVTRLFNIDKIESVP